MTRRMMLCLILLAAAPAGKKSWASDAQITVDNFTFSPPAITVAAGSTVTWINHDDIPHKIIGQGDLMALTSPVLDTDDSFSHVFDRPGTYAYFCSLHPHMQGQVVVR